MVTNGTRSPPSDGFQVRPGVAAQGRTASCAAGPLRPPIRDPDCHQTAPPSRPATSGAPHDELCLLLLENLRCSDAGSWEPSDVTPPPPLPLPLHSRGGTQISAPKSFKYLPTVTIWGGPGDVPSLPNRALSLLHIGASGSRTSQVQDGAHRSSSGRVSHIPPGVTACLPSTCSHLGSSSPHQARRGGLRLPQPPCRPACHPAPTLLLALSSRGCRLAPALRGTRENSLAGWKDRGSELWASGCRRTPARASRQGSRPEREAVCCPVIGEVGVQMNSDFGETSALCCLEGDSGPATSHLVGQGLPNQCPLPPNQEDTRAPWSTTAVS